MYVSNLDQPWPSKYPRSVRGSRVAKRLAAPMVTCDLKQILMAVKAILVVAQFSRIRKTTSQALPARLRSAGQECYLLAERHRVTDSGPARHLARDGLIHVKR